MNSFPEIERKPELLNRIKISNSSLYLKIQQGVWPKPVNLGINTVAWLTDESNQVMKAMFTGKTQDEIRELVSELEKNREKHLGANQS